MNVSSFTYLVIYITFILKISVRQTLVVLMFKSKSDSIEETLSNRECKGDKEE